MITAEEALSLLESIPLYDCVDTPKYCSKLPRTMYVSSIVQVLIDPSFLLKLYDPIVEHYVTIQYLDVAIDSSTMMIVMKEVSKLIAF